MEVEEGAGLARKKRGGLGGKGRLLSNDQA